MNDLQIFKSEKFGEIRTIEIKGEPWFVGKDIAEALGYSDTNKAVAMHVDSEDKLNDKSSPSFGQRGTWILNESGVYSLILSSKLPQAKQFKHWITSEILPAIRKHGLYATDELLNNPDFLIEALTALKEERAKNAALQPKAEYYDKVAESKGLTNFRETAKLFGIKEREFTRFIEDKKLCYRNSLGKLLPYAKYSDLFEVKEVTYGHTDDIRTTVYTKITPLGRTKIFDKMKKEGVI